MIKIRISDAKGLKRRLQSLTSKFGDKAPSRTIESGRVGTSRLPPVTGTAGKLLKQAATRRKMAALGPSSARQYNLRLAEKLEQQATSVEALASGRQQPPVAKRQLPANQAPVSRADIADATAEIRKAFGEIKSRAATPETPETPETTAPPSTKPQRIMPLERRGVPNPQSLNREDYRNFYGTDRDVSPALGKSAESFIIAGPTALNHEGRLRRTGKVSGHWAMYAYLVNVDGKPTLGVQFKSGFRAFYPGTGETDYRAIVNAESGSYYAHDHLRRRAYSAF